MPQARIQIFNGKKRNKGKRSKGKKSNPGELSFLFNGKGRSKMAQKKKGKGKRNSHRSNPRNTAVRRSKGRHGRRNSPMGGGREGGTAAVIEYGGGAIASGLLSHLVMESFLPQWNSGAMAYLGTLIIGGGVAYVGGKMLGKRVFYGGLAGTALAVAYRAVEDMGVTAPKAVAADVRDAQATQATSGAPAPGYGVSGMGRRMRGMGTIIPFPFNVPQSYQVVNGQLVPVLPALPAAAVPGPQPAGGAAAMSGLGRGIPPVRRIDRRSRY